MARSREKSNPVWSQVLGRIRKDYLSGKLKAGDLFPSLNDICDKYKVSKITGIRVVSELEKMELVERIHGKGTFVRYSGTPFGIKLVMQLAGDNQPSYVLPIIWRYFQGVEKECSRNKCTMEIVTPEYINSTGVERELFVYMASGGDCDEAFFSRIRGTNHLCACLHSLKAIDGINTIRTDYGAAVELTAGTLAERNHKRIAFLSGPVDAPWYVARFKGYCNALDKAMLPLDPKLVAEVPSCPSQSDIEAVVKNWLSLENPPDAVACSDDLRALALMSYCKQNGIKVPETLAITGLDNRYESTVSQPQLTTVDLQWDWQGQLAVRMLLEQALLPCADAVDTVVPPKLVIRESE